MNEELKEKCAQKKLASCCHTRQKVEAEVNDLQKMVREKLNLMDIIEQNLKQEIRVLHEEVRSINVGTHDTIHKQVGFLASG